MTKQHMSARILDKLIILSIFSLFIVPLLVPYSYFPVSKFYSEILVLIIAAVFSLFTFYRVSQLSVSSTGIASILFTIFLILQIGVINIRIPGVNLAVALEFFILYFLSIGVTSLVENNELQQQKLIKTVAFAVLIGSTIQALYALLQFTGIAENFRDYILYVGSDSIYAFGNIGQKNDYVDFITIGVFALAYLYFIEKINLLIFTLYSTFFLVMLTITTSRTPFAFFIAAFISLFIFMFINRKNTDKSKNKKVLFIVSFLFVGLLVLEIFLPKIMLLIDGRDITSGIFRFSSENIGQSTYRRFYEWYKCIIMFIHNPLFGVGWYQYSKEAIYLMLSDRFMYIPANSALYTHSHNTPLNILAETGIVGFIITMVYGFAFSLYYMFKKFNNYATLFLLFMILTIFTQSLFQYPLWYAYFLAYFIFFLSINKAVYTITNTRVIKGVVTVLFTGFIWFCFVNFSMYNKVMELTDRPQEEVMFKNNVVQLEKIIDNNPLWALPALSVLDTYNMPTFAMTNSALTIEEQKRYIDMLSNELPYPGGIFKQVIICKLIGDNSGAIFYANLLAHAYPYYKEQFAMQLAKSEVFKEEVDVINNFKYEDKSIFKKLFPKKEQK
ncbi:MAG TPA: Wzy polymerase domain-containing protein [Burkholderiales bacterium]|nr:Wzy polymerase domain-containing protein [Burkholderiales bacterium]